MPGPIVQAHTGGVAPKETCSKTKSNEYQIREKTEADHGQGERAADKDRASQQEDQGGAGQHHHQPDHIDEGARRRR